jgi:hypothetical protein
VLTKRDLEEVSRLWRPSRMDVADLVAEVHRLAEALEEAVELHREEVGPHQPEGCPMCAFLSETLQREV